MPEVTIKAALAWVMALACATTATAQSRATAELRTEPERPNESTVSVNSLNLPPRVPSDTIQFSVETADAQPMSFALAVRRGVGEPTLICGFDAMIRSCRVAATSVPSDADLIVSTLTEAIRSRATLVATVTHTVVDLASGKSFTIAFPQDIVEITVPSQRFQRPALVDIVAETDGVLFSVQILDPTTSAMLAGSHVSAQQQTVVLRVLPSRFLVEFNRLDTGARTSATARVTVRQLDDQQLSAIGVGRGAVDRATQRLRQTSAGERWPTPADGLAFKWSLSGSEYDRLR
jgi:hypothetical protein